MEKTKQLPHYYAKPTWENNIGYLLYSRRIILPGVSEILKTTKPKTEKQRLINWQKKSRQNSSQSNFSNC
ncbi:MAG: hypothetical protein F6K40_38450 [Okeania sp. SIO3I5]|uniref:hypothetical protein n=1 Tax=Okeania sp. SIO3I5 TaxID=2607805 RepID=UPI0013BCFBCC|nr:hypothetical protein [Okeania sp. SIO3I5]NEQ41753.1 hypothetical protein [Okeania sp. SIO3I5]